MTEIVDSLQLERRFKLRNMSADLVDEFAERVINGMNEMFDHDNKPLLTESKCLAVKTVFHKYFGSQ